jgi:tetratricopeptide (TPR) repeat protein
MININFKLLVAALLGFTSCHAQNDSKVKLLNDTLFKIVGSTPHRTGEDSDFHKELYYIKQVLEIDSVDNSALLLKAQILAHLGKYDSSIQLLNILVDRKKWERALYFRAAVYDILNDTAKARADYRNILTRNAKSLNTVADSSMKVQLLGSLSFYNMLVGADKKNVLSAFNAGVARWRSAKTEKLIKITRGGIVTFTREGFLKDYRKGLL